MQKQDSQILIFYRFQLDDNPEYNLVRVQGIANTEMRIKDVIDAIPIDTASGCYHYRFQSEFEENGEKLQGWIDISNLTARVPIINEAIFVKILALKDHTLTKHFTVEKLNQAAELQKSKLNHRAETHKRLSPNKKSAEDWSSSLAKDVQKSSAKKGEADKTEDQPVCKRPQLGIKAGQSNIGQIHQGQKIGQAPTVAKQQQLIDIDLLPTVQAKFDPHTSAEEKLQVMQQAREKEQRDKEEESKAKEQLEPKINAWGYTDGKKINNTPTLLATLHEIWPDWNPVSLSDMLKPELVAAQFKKAVIKVHPDKNRNADYLQKYLSKRVFELLHQSRKM